LIWYKPSHDLLPALHWFPIQTWSRYIPRDGIPGNDVEERDLDLLGRFFSSPNARLSPCVRWYHVSLGIIDTEALSKSAAGHLSSSALCDLAEGHQNDAPEKIGSRSDTTDENPPFPSEIK
jgi:hypothetical protein